MALLSRYKLKRAGDVPDGIHHERQAPQLERAWRSGRTCVPSFIPLDCGHQSWNRHGPSWGKAHSWPMGIIG